MWWVDLLSDWGFLLVLPAAGLLVGGRFQHERRRVKKIANAELAARLIRAPDSLDDAVDRYRRERRETRARELQEWDYDFAVAKKAAPLPEEVAEIERRKVAIAKAEEERKRIAGQWRVPALGETVIIEDGEWMHELKRASGGAVEMRTFSLAGGRLVQKVLVPVGDITSLGGGVVRSYFEEDPTKYTRGGIVRAQQMRARYGSGPLTEMAMRRSIAELAREERRLKMLIEAERAIRNPYSL